MGFKKTITILLTVCMVGSLAAGTVNAAGSSHSSHSYSSSSSTGNTIGIAGGSTGNGTSVSEAQATGIVGSSTGNVYGAFTGSPQVYSNQQLKWLRGPMMETAVDLI